MKKYIVFLLAAFVLTSSFARHNGEQLKQIFYITPEDGSATTR